MDAIFDHRPRPYTVVEDIVFECNLSSLQKLTLISLFKYAGKQSAAWPGVETLALCTSSSSRQIRRILHDLQKIGLLKIEHRPGQSSLYHIPKYRLCNNRLCGVWDTPDTMSGPDTMAGVNTSTPDTVSAHPGHHVRTPRTPCHPNNLKNSIKEHLSPREANNKPPPDLPETRRENFFNDDLIADWSKNFSMNHLPESIQEQTAMDWMLYASMSNLLGRINSPIGYLKTITRKGFPQNFPSYHDRKRKKGLPRHIELSVEQRWQNLNPVHKQLFFEEAKEHTVKDDQLEDTAFKLFLASLVNNPKKAQNTPCTKHPIKSPPAPRVVQC